MKKLMLMFIVMSTLVYPSLYANPKIPQVDNGRLEEKLTPQQQLGAVAEALEYDLSHVTIKAVPMRAGLRGIACNPNLVLTSKSLWEKAGNKKNFIHVMHEVGHTLGLFHDRTQMMVLYRYEPIWMPETAMDTPSPGPLVSTLFKEHYVKEMKLRLQVIGNTGAFWYANSSPVKAPYTEEQCLTIVSPAATGELNGYDETRSLDPRYGCIE